MQEVHSTEWLGEGQMMFRADKWKLIYMKEQEL